MKLQLIGAGNNRTCFLLSSKKYVLKFPENELGEQNNIFEAFYYKKYPREPFARCRLVPRSSLLVMEYVEPAEFRGGFKEIKRNNEWIGCPGWVLSIDCCQVGWSRAGKLVAYDYA